MSKLKIEKDYGLNFEGEKDSSLFFRPLLEGMDQKCYVKMEKTFSDFYKRYGDTHDDRALAIIGLLSIENELDHFLSSWMKKYYDENMDKNTLYSKIKLATSLNLIPNKILESIEPIRKIRNIFAHNLDIDYFEKAKVRDSTSFSNLYKHLKKFNINDIQDDKEAFMKLILMIIVALNIYASHMIKIREYIWNPKNLEEIMVTNL